MEEESLPEAWEFLAGVNLNGEAVEVNGSTWLSHAEATSAGLKVEGLGKGVQLKTSAQQPTGLVSEAGLRRALQSKVAVEDAKLMIKWPQENGRYQVFVWMMEDEGNSVRSVTPMRSSSPRVVRRVSPR